MFLHSAYPFLLPTSMEKGVCQFAFCKVVGKKAALMEAEAGTKATHVVVGGCGLFPPTLRHS